MVGQTFTYLIGPDASALLLNSKMTNSMQKKFVLEQKKILKTGVTSRQFRKHVPLITKEAQEYFKRWGDKGETDLCVAVSQLLVLTTSSCLHGKEIRSMLNERVAQLYADLESGFNTLGWLFPPWVPFPSFLTRDRAHRELKKIFYKAIKQRRESQEEEEEDDMLQVLIDTKYKNGKHLTDEEIAGLCIALLMAGQSTTTTTSSWLGFFLAQNKQVQESCYEEQQRICGADPEYIPDYDETMQMTYLDRCVKEALRLRAPIPTMLRLAKVPLSYRGYTIPPGHTVCVSPIVNQCLDENWSPDPNAFNPDRFLDESTLKSDNFNFIPFGAGRHRCIGEHFAQLQMKTIWSVLLRKFEFDLVDGQFPPTNYATMIHKPINPNIRYQLRQKSQ
ncbi:lanosterol 14-alpha demethylase-like [Amphiura filiformis]|uniref:lanosterol 14-alpha demethylase-like n=1 Tax=Amphiura filiformis TaxID=82378 RepID=UPI003B215907